MKKIFISLISFILLCFLIDCYGEQVKDEYLVKLNMNKNSSFYSFFRTKSIGKELKNSWNKLRLHHVKLDKRNLELFKTSLDSQIEYIEPNIIYHAIPVDETFLRRRVKPYTETQWGLDAIDAYKAWEITQGDKNIKVAVIDTGIDCKHPALKGHCLQGWNFVTNKPNGFDDNIHGTHCAGIIAADIIQAKGVAPKVTVMAVKFLDSTGSGSLSAAISSIQYAIKNGARILSNSWGGYGYSQALFDAIKDSKNKGAIFIAAAGNETNDNDSDSPSYPSSYKIDNIIAVAAIDKDFNIASFSNYGVNTVHIGAPGVNIYSTIPNNSYKYLSGTSMATPFVSGLAALMLSRYPDASVEEIKNRILNNASPLNSLSDKTSTGGMINALKSL